MKIVLHLSCQAEGSLDPKKEEALIDEVAHRMAGSKVLEPFELDGVVVTPETMKISVTE